MIAVNNSLNHHQTQSYVPLVCLPSIATNLHLTSNFVSSYILYLYPHTVICKINNKISDKDGINAKLEINIISLIYDIYLNECEYEWVN